MSYLRIIVIVTVSLHFYLFVEAYDLNVTNEETCELCTELVDGLKQGIRDGVNDLELAYVTIQGCTELELQPPYVCEGVVMNHLEIAGFILRNKPNLTSQFICSVMFQGLGCHRNESDEPNIKLEIDSNRPKICDSKNNIPSSNKEDELVIVQITDTHVDLHYEVGANAVCNAPACCRKSQGMPSDPFNGAGEWGDYRGCDAPLKSFINVLEHIKATQKKIDYIYYAGDTADHAVWETTSGDNQENMKKTFEAIRNYFPNTPLIPNVGNHESHPMNQFSPVLTGNQNISTAELYKFLANYWDWLPLDARKTIEIGGYYTMLLRKGLRIIALNNNDCFTLNLWLLYDPTFPMKQIQWLHDTLLLAEKKDEKVHILAHIPTNNHNEYYDVYGREFRKIVDRFWNTISLILNGHTHADEFCIFYSLADPSIAVNVAFNGGSTTPYTFVNPNYKVYKVEPESYQVVNQDVYIYNLTEANDPLVGSPKWYKEYDFLTAYGLENLSPASLDKLLDEMALNPTKLELYWKHKVKMGDPSLKAGCSSECLSFVSNNRHGGPKYKVQATFTEGINEINLKIENSFIHNHAIKKTFVFKLRVCVNISTSPTVFQCSTTNLLI